MVYKYKGFAGNSLQDLDSVVPSVDDDQPSLVVKLNTAGTVKLTKLLATLAELLKETERGEFGLNITLSNNFPSSPDTVDTLLVTIRISDHDFPAFFRSIIRTFLGC